MKKIAEFFSKWAFAIMICVGAVALLFALGCCIYTAITNPFVGIVGIVGVVLALTGAVGIVMGEIKRG